MARVRILFWLGFVSCFVLLLAAAYFQLVEDLEPCPLCVSQRVIILVLGGLFLAAALHNPRRLGVRIYSSLVIGVALLGAGISARHVWLQNLPAEEVPECSPGLAYVFDNFPLAKTLKLMLNGTGECADISWIFLGLTIPGWTLVAFLLLALVGLLQFKTSTGEGGL
ncbi:MAG TPA: disulfide bond formation protein B [Methylococcaceae bacterium]|jgi:disulfide bond formation protein DsbB|nr:disulfide bond formation protein B [Methylococcaceae bacterium]HIO45181.1 disulfide bond formation protein B [Methylococcales bacterium]